VLYELRLKGLSVAEVARRAGLKGSGASRVASRRWPRLEAAIAQQLGVPPSVIWPERYLPNGLPIRFPGGRPRRNRPDRAAA